MTESVVGKEEEERHQKLVTENEQLKRQIEEVTFVYSISQRFGYGNSLQRAHRGLLALSTIYSQYASHVTI